MYWFNIFKLGELNISATGTGGASGDTKFCIECCRYTYHNSGGCTECHKKPHITRIYEPLETADIRRTLSDIRGGSMANKEIIRIIEGWHLETDFDNMERSEVVEHLERSDNKDYAKYTLKQILAVLDTCNDIDEARCYFQAYFA